MGTHKQTFENGLNQDINKTFQPPGTYRDLHNGMLISHDGNHFTIESALGNTLSFSIPPRYSANCDFSTTPPTIVYDSLPMPIGFISLVDLNADTLVADKKIVVFSTNSQGNPEANPAQSGGYGEIGVVTINDANVATYTPIYNHASLNFTQYRKIRGLGYPENEKIERVYWTDNFNNGRVLNIKDSYFINMPAPFSTIQNGVQYMVIGGIVLYNGTYYGSGLPNGNVFTYDSANPAPTVIDGNPILNEYILYQSLDFVPGKYLANINFIRFLTGGTLTGGAKQYFYRLGFSNQGYYSAWSPGSYPINVGLKSPGTYYNTVGCGVITANSQKGILLEIDNIDTVFDTIEVACASYDSDKDVITNIQSVFRGTITGSTMQISHYGTEDIADWTVADISTFTASIDRFKDLTTSKNYLLIGNIKERPELTIDTSSVTIGNRFYYLPADNYGNRFSKDNTHDGIGGHGIFPNGGVLNESAGQIGSPQQAQLYQNNDYGVASMSGGYVYGNCTNELQVDGNYVVQGGAGDAIIYNGTTYNSGEVFTVVNGVFDYTVQGNAIVQACIVLNQYNEIISSVTVPKQKIIPILNDFWDYKGGATTQYLRQYMSGETYRFALVFFDKKGNPFFARWIGDHQLPDIETKGGLLKPYLFNNNSTCQSDPEFNMAKFSYRLNGILINGVTIPQSLLSEVSGFSIMRAPRDKQRYAQGLLWQTVSDLDTDANQSYIKPLGGNIISTDWYYSQYILGNGKSNGIVDKIFTFYAPDAVFGDKETNSINPLGSSLELACGLDALGNSAYYVNTGGSSMSPDSQTVKGSLAGYNFAGGIGSKNYLIGNNGYWKSSGIKTTPIQTWVLMKSDDVVSGIHPPSYAFFNGRTAITSSSLGGDYISWDSSSNVLIKTEDDLYLPYSSPQAIYGSGTIKKFTGNAAADLVGSTMKGLCNLYVQKTSLYGGQTPSAIANTPFISTGHYQDLTNIDFSKVPQNSNGDYVFNNIDVFGGDTFLNIVDYCRLFPDQNSHTYGMGSLGKKDAYGAWCYFPCETTLNIALREGNSVTKNFVLPFSGTGIGNASTSVPENLYTNKAYPSEGTQFVYPALPVNFTNASFFAYRVRWAGAKISGEIIDSFRQFLTNNYRDLNGERGQINNLETKDNKVFFWQDNAVGYLPIQERVATSGLEGQDVQLGIGGVVDRFDEINSYFGNQHQNSLCQTEKGFIWFDMQRRALLTMSAGAEIGEISAAKGLQSFFNTVFETQLSNNPIKNTDTPLMGIGITSVFDPKFKMTYITFKNFDASNNKMDFTVGYSHQRECIVGFYDFCPAISHSFNDFVFAANEANSNIKSIQDSTSYSVGNVIFSNNALYVCTNPITTSSPVQFWQLPEYGYITPTPTNPPPANPLFWTKIYASNEVYLSNYGDMAKFFGLVYPLIFEAIINPQTNDAFTVDTLEVKGTNVNSNRVDYSNDNDSATDYLPNRNYRFWDGKWFNNVAVGKMLGRLTDTYLSARFTKNNYVSNPTVSSNENKVIAYIKSVFRERK